LVGYIAFLDPPKESAGRALAALAKHGVQVKVLTGDNEIVTRKIWREVGLPVERVVLGSELESLTPVQLAELAKQAQVFAKLSASQKAVIITALQRKHHVVGFLGDGINDGPALKTADVGIAVAAPPANGGCGRVLGVVGDACAEMPRFRAAGGFSPQTRRVEMALFYRHAA
jgi:P-type Mg2+ transporter